MLGTTYVEIISLHLLLSISHPWMQSYLISHCSGHAAPSTTYVFPFTKDLHVVCHTGMHTMQVRRGKGCGAGSGSGAGSEGAVEREMEV